VEVGEAGGVAELAGTVEGAAAGDEGGTVAGTVVAGTVAGALRDAELAGADGAECGVPCAGKLNRSTAASATSAAATASSRSLRFRLGALIRGTRGELTAGPAPARQHGSRERTG
jgi:hypothetical protein